MEPIVILAELHEPMTMKEGIQGYLVAGQEQNPYVSGGSMPAIWIGFGDKTMFLHFEGTKRLRDLCNAVLATNVASQEPNVVDIIGPDPASDPKAVNPGGEAAEQWGG